MKAFVLSEAGKPEISEKEKPQPAAGELLIRLKAAALNHRDEWIREGRYPGIKEGVTLGSDGAGVVEAAGDQDHQHWVGKEVLINPNINWGEDPEVQSADFMILGMPVDGTFAEYIALPAHRLHEKPAHLSMEQAAAFPLGGLTAFRALFTHGNLQKGEKVLINGIGGGVAQFAFQYALAAGAEVWVTSSNEEKRQYAEKRGARGSFNYKDENWSAEAAKASGGGFDLIIDSAGGDGMNQLIDALRPAGSLVLYGATAGVPSSLNLRKIFWKQIRLQGSTMGNDQEFKEMLAFISKHKIEPIMEDPYPFDKIIKAFDTMKEGKQLGKLVVTINSSLH